MSSAVTDLFPVSVIFLVTISNFKKSVASITSYRASVYVVVSLQAHTMNWLLFQLPFFDYLISTWTSYIIRKKCYTAY